MEPKTTLILTCEHGGNLIPARFQRHFTKATNALRSHRGFDIGALSVARSFSKSLNCPLIYADISRLLIDLNRSEDNKNLFSIWTSDLPDTTKEQILKQHYNPYRTHVTNHIKSQIEHGHRVIHLSIHSFTPILQKTIRTTAIGVLYDPNRKFESKLARRLTEEIKRQLPELRTKKNYPYRGTSDGLTRYLRTLFPQTRYAGLEIELNQFLLSTSHPWLSETNQPSTTANRSIKRAILHSQKSPVRSKKSIIKHLTAAINTSLGSI